MSHQLVANEEKNICEIKHEKSNGWNKKKHLSVYKILFFSLPLSHTNEFHLGFVPFSSNLHIAATARLRLNRAADGWLVMFVRGRKTEWKKWREEGRKGQWHQWDIALRHQRNFFSGMKEHSNIKLFMRNASSFNSLWSKMFSGNYSASRQLFCLHQKKTFQRQTGSKIWLLIIHMLTLNDCQNVDLWWRKSQRTCIAQHPSLTFIVVNFKTELEDFSRAHKSPWKIHYYWIKALT